MQISLNKNIVLRDYQDKGLLINTLKAEYRKVNSSGLLIAKLLEEYHKIEKSYILKELSDFYRIPESLIEDDVTSFIQDLLEKGFLVIDEESVEEDDDKIDENYSSNGVWFQITNRCNLKCKYCYANSGYEMEEEITIEEIEDVLKALNKRNYNKIIITGGEPLMRKDLLDILKVCSNYGKVQLLTNGTIGEEETYKKILQYVSMIQISIDSYDKDKHESNRGINSFEKVINTIKIISKLDNTKLTLALTPTPEYMADLVDMIKFCLSLDVYSLHINRFVPYGRAKIYSNRLNLEQFYKWADKGYEFLYQTYIDYYKQKKQFSFQLDVASDLRKEVFSKGKKYSCGLNQNLLSIDSKGNVFLCPSLHKEELKLGNIRNNVIDDIMGSAKKDYNSFCVDQLHGCSKCEIKYYCGGGCRAIALNDCNDLYGIEDNCNVYKNRVYNLMLS